MAKITCKGCGDEMRGLDVYDQGAGGHIAYNLYQCDDCGMVLINHVWEGAGNYWIDPQEPSTVTFESVGTPEGEPA